MTYARSQSYAGVKISLAGAELPVEMLYFHHLSQHVFSYIVLTIHLS